MKRFFFLGLIVCVGACHIISGGDEIEVAGEEDDEGSSSSSSSSSESAVTVGGGSCPIPSNLPLGTGDPFCDNCLLDNCCNEITLCDNSPGCVDFVYCYAGTGDSFCYEQYPGGGAMWDALESCGYAHCDSECSEGFGS